MKDNAQLLLVSGLLMTITIIAVSSTITHSVNTATYQGERHDLTPLMSTIIDDFPLALEYEVDNAESGTSLETSFDSIAETFESLFASKGYSLYFDLTSISSETNTFIYTIELSDGTMNIRLNQTASF